RGGELSHTMRPHAEIDLDPLREILQRDFNPDGYQEAEELILGACQEAQTLYGWVPKPAAQAIADHLGVSINRIFALLTFYADFRTDPPGDHAMLLCHGAACFVMGSDRLIREVVEDEHLTADGRTPDGVFSVQVVNGCLGVCNLAPVAQIDHHTYVGHLDRARLAEVMQAIRNGQSVEDLDAVE
ncbi:MAG TPA: NAD(P)H-dependent oxidoreductase subunit E, partial [Nitrolancea sp.]|nr:NAD(P)H-dependent oxidoreductase subunit E [Nitrolancea sp.]